jgi:hypothetical protein
MIEAVAFLAALTIAAPAFAASGIDLSANPHLPRRRGLEL